MACLFVSYASLNGENVTPTLLLSPRVERWGICAEMATKYERYNKLQKWICIFINYLEYICVKGSACCSHIFSKSKGKFLKVNSLHGIVSIVKSSVLCVILFITDEICIFFWILYFYSQSIQTHTYFTEHLVGPAIFVFLIGWGWMAAFWNTYLLSRNSLHKRWGWKWYQKLPLRALSSDFLKVTVLWP